MSETRVKIEVGQPYDVDAILGFLSMRAIEGVEQVDSSGRYRRTYRFGRYAGVLSVEFRCGATNLWLEVDVSHGVILNKAIARVRHLFDLDHKPQRANRVLRRTARLARLIKVRPGLRVPGGWSDFEIVVRAMLGQQVTVRAATRLAGKLVATYGERLPARHRCDGLTHSFPKAHRLAQADLGVLGMPGARARAIAAVANTFGERPAFLAESGDPLESIKRLKSLPGIGEWTAQYIAMRALHFADAFPTGDIGLLRGMADSAGKRPSAEQLQMLAEAWRPWRAYACLHVWAADAAS